jgi:serine/threonine protein phosphatase PrpC
MTLSGRRELEPEDVLFVCTDGMWAPLRDDEIANRFTVGGHAVGDALSWLGQLAVTRSGGASDNTSGAAVRWLGD